MKVILTISLLISNRPDTVRKCLDSIQPLLREVPSELILTDTGCGEEVRSIIEEYTDNIIEFEWCKDFAKARNVGLKRAKGEWFLFLDDDEWFEDTTEIINFFNSGEYKKYGMGAYIQRNYLDRTGSVYTDLPVGRMVRLDPGVEFMYSIHECFNHVPGKVKKFADFVHHYGYVYDTEEARRAHSNRNIELLLIEHEKNPRNMKHTLQLAQEYNAVEEYEKGLELCLEGIALSKTGPVEIEFCLNSLFANAIECYIELHREEEAVVVGEKYLSEEKLDPLVRAMIAGLLAKEYLVKGEADKCLERVMYYNEVYQEYHKDEEAFIGYVTTITSDCFEQRNRSAVLGSGVLAAIEKDKIDVALHWFHNMGLNEERIFVKNEMIKAIIERIIQNGIGVSGEVSEDIVGMQEESATKIVEDSEKQGESTAAIKERTSAENHALHEMCNTLLQRKELEGYIAKTILESCSTPEQLAAFADLESNHWLFALANVFAGEDCLNNALTVWKNMPESISSIRKYGMMEELDAAGANVGELLAEIPYYIWDKGLEKYIRSCSKEELEWLVQWEELLPEEQALKVLSFWRKVRYCQLLKNEDAIWSEQEPEKIGECLWDYTADTVTLCQLIYRTDILNDSIDVLPTEYQAAFWMHALKMNLEENNLNDAIEIVKLIKELVPELNGAMKYVLMWIQKKSEESRTEQTAAQKELQLLGMQIKTKIHQLLESGETQTALAVARQLQGMLPDDEEVREIVQKLAEEVG